MNEAKTIHGWAKTGKKLCGQTFPTPLTMDRVLRKCPAPSQGKTNKGGTLYFFDDLETSYREYKKVTTATSKGGDGQLHDKDFLDLKKEKLKNEITKQELEIETLKLRLIDYDEVLEYLIKRKAVEVSILKKVLLSQVPIEITGLTPPDARVKCIEYFNDIVKELNSTIEKWEDDFAREEVEVPEVKENVFEEEEEGEDE